ncbi:MAG: hypothetical protein WAV46_00545 [Candidatus Moraniibacteriota bacterium]
MSLFEKFFSSKKEEDFVEHLPEAPDVQPGLEETPIILEIDHNKWQESNPGGVKEIIGRISEEEAAERERQRIIDKIIEERDNKTN